MLSVLAHHSTGFQKQFGNELVDVLPAPELAIWDLQDYSNVHCRCVGDKLCMKMVYRSKTEHCILQTWLWVMIWIPRKLIQYFVCYTIGSCAWSDCLSHPSDILPPPTAPLNINTSRSPLTVKIIQMQKHNSSIYPSTYLPTNRITKILY